MIQQLCYSWQNKIFSLNKVKHIKNQKMSTLMLNQLNKKNLTKSHILGEGPPAIELNSPELLLMLLISGLIKKNCC